MKKVLSTLAATLASTSLSMAVIELDIANVIAQTGSTNTPPTPPTNVTPMIGQFAQYELDLFDTDTSISSTAYLQITLDSFTADISNHRISTGQGFPDRAGISIGGTGAYNGSATYTFSFFSDSGFTTPLDLNDFTMQISDIDEVEDVTVSQSEFASVSLTPATQLSIDSSGGDYTVTNIVGENLPKDNANAAANFNSVSDISSFSITLSGSGSNGGAREFQFDFTPDLVVPEPSAYSLLIGLSALGMIATRRRSR